MGSNPTLSAIILSLTIHFFLEVRDATPSPFSDSAASSFQNFYGAIFCSGPSEPARINDLGPNSRLRKNT